MIRVHRIPFSTNVERVALAAAHKGVEVEWVDHDPDDRSAILELSGQELVPVAEIDGQVVSDSMGILEALESHAPEPPLYPPPGAERAAVAIFSEWFNQVWKGPPNLIDSERLKAEPDTEMIADLLERTHSSLGLFEVMLERGDFLFGPRLGLADVCAFPFLKYAAIDPEPGDAEAFHAILAESLRPAAEAPKLLAWIARIDAMPRA